MFGYVRPMQPELKCKDFDLYRATYCGLCRTMRQRYGVIAPMFLNFDFTFLALLLSQAEERPQLCKGRCHGNPLRKKTMCETSPALEIAADESIILAYWKLRDGAVDEGFWRGLPQRMLALLLGPSYRRAVGYQPHFDKVVQGCLDELAQLEKTQCDSIDRTADTFARILKAAAPQSEDAVQHRALEELLYHVGRWIYLIDARDDFHGDITVGSYNPLVFRYGEAGDDEALACTLNHSMNLARSAFQLGTFGCRQPIIENILYLGLPLTQEAVFRGLYQQIKKQKLWSN